MFEFDSLNLNTDPFGFPVNQDNNSSFGGQSDAFENLMFPQTKIFEDQFPELIGGNGTDIYDCGSSSGYGSPGPAATPITNPDGLYFGLGLQQVSPIGPFNNLLGENNNKFEENDNFMNFLPQGEVNPNNFLFNKAFNVPSPKQNIPPPSIISKTMKPYTDGVMEEICLPKKGCNSKKEEPKVAATDDGFDPEEIAEFSRLLSSPKKAPPSKYQCHICFKTGHYISDCPSRFSSPFEELTPYQGRKKCYGEFQCQQCKRKWTSQNSVANEAQSCIKCHISVFPHKQLPVEKAVSLGLVKPSKHIPAGKIAPIGSGRPTHTSH
uniref:CCHC-type domain-containing protein n=1 Tax=Strongyloides venezuelensis TaxID=75913 RepID=A0A0K0EXS2_STRVS